MDGKIKLALIFAVSAVATLLIAYVVVGLPARMTLPIIEIGRVMDKYNVKFIVLIALVAAILYAVMKRNSGHT